MLWISVHVPKTAGTSFRHALESHFGAARICLDYGDRPMNVPSLARKTRALWELARGLVSPWPAVDCIHGHFLPLKYAGLARRGPVKFITWLRDPIDRLLSAYRHYRRQQVTDSTRMNGRVAREQWPLDKFLLHPHYRDRYARFLWRFPLERFDFVGITEHYQDDLEDLGEQMGARLE
ncbi:MAG: sulfotransferase family 2 domain-containing protein, partial [Gemmataceae bacterium]